VSPVDQLAIQEDAGAKAISRGRRQKLWCDRVPRKTGQDGMGGLSRCEREMTRPSSGSDAVVMPNVGFRGYFPRARKSGHKSLVFMEELERRGDSSIEKGETRPLRYRVWGPPASGGKKPD